MIIDYAAEPFSAFFAQVDTSAPCWVWRGRKAKKGYGVFRHDGRDARAHRWSWEALVGPIPTGLVLDHLCRNHSCVNPDHLEPVTRAENTRRGPIPKRNASQTQCPAGHRYIPENTVVYDGKRKCRACVSQHKRDHHARRLPALGAAHQLCWSGHELTEANTMELPGGYPACRRCLDGWGFRT